MWQRLLANFKLDPQCNLLVVQNTEAYNNICNILYKQKTHKDERSKWAYTGYTHTFKIISSNKTTPV